MGLFRRREPLHERLAREGGLGAPPPHDTQPHWGTAGIHGVPRAREWDAVVSTDAELEGKRAAFVALPDGTLVVEDGPDDVQQLADALETELSPPYRAEAVHRDDGVWAVAGRRIEVARLQAEGEVLDLAMVGGESTLHVDGEQAFGSLPELERLAGREGRDYAVHAERIDGDLWDIRIAPL